MNKFLALVALLVAGSAGATTVDLDSIGNASLDHSNAITLSLAAGTYSVTPVIGAYTAFSRFDAVVGCNASGLKCSTGYEHSYLVGIGGVTTGYGDNDGGGGIGPLPGNDGYYDTMAKAFALGAKASTFTLAAPADVAFWILDDGTYNNTGGVSLDVRPVPEPGEWAMMLAGLAVTAGFARRRRKLDTRP